MLPVPAAKKPRLGHSFEKPSDCLSSTAQTISSRPATATMVQAMRSAWCQGQRTRRPPHRAACFPHTCRPRLRPMSESLVIGGQLGSYLIESVIGRGGMSTVYRAVHTRLGTPVALKVLSPELSEDDAFRERFLREAKMAAAIDHPNVIPIYDTGLSGDSL